MKPIRALIATAIFMVLLLSAYMAHVSLFRVNVVFYAAIGDALIASVAAAAVLFLMKFFRCLSGFEKVLLVVIWLLGGYTFAISIPTVIDRSLSFYILEKLQQRGGGIRQDSFARVFTDEYLIEHRLVDVRLTEQLESGTIKIENGCVRLTERGERVAAFSRYFRKNWLPKKRLLMGNYSEDLTDPFRHSRDDHAYNCR
jgi:hypothetical protein